MPIRVDKTTCSSLFTFPVFHPGTLSIRLKRPVRYVGLAGPIDSCLLLVTTACFEAIIIRHIYGSRYAERHYSFFYS
ncbi:hypothetical protein [Spirosoma litoris]